MQISNMFWIITMIFSLLSCNQHQGVVQDTEVPVDIEKKMTISQIIPAADRVELYLPSLKGKQVGLVVNQTSRVGEQHLLDFLLAEHVKVLRLFAPEHGFRGEADAGEKIDSQKDSRTGIEIRSLYGKAKKPSDTDLKGIDLMVFDIQDVGVRFYTYISTLHYVMEACAENNVPLIVLDRPNPNGHYVDGPILEEEFSSFVGMHPVPVVYGMTIGEYAQMINGEQWLKNKIQCDLTVIQCKNYDHTKSYDLPIKPSPNLPNRKSVLLYPSLCFFEGTTWSVGRGTEMPFQVYGHPSWTNSDFYFKPKSISGAKYPKHKGKQCGGRTFIDSNILLKNQKQLDLSYLLHAYELSQKNNITFFNDNNFFEKLAGTASLRAAMINQDSEEIIRASWRKALMKFRMIRRKYLIY